jgi:16S rRNA (guanine966-N2)-methyltransferase
VRVIDLFAGTGAYGIEALSRGAAMALFVEREAKAAETIRVNLAALALGPDVARVLVADVARLGPPTGPPADIAFLDPPWGADLATAGLAPLAAGWLAPGGLALVETAAREDWEAPPGWTMSADRRWGRARVTVLRLEGGVDR